MRAEHRQPPLTRRGRLIVPVILALVVLAWTLDSARKSEVFNSDMHLVSNMISKDLNPALFSQDYFLHDDSFYRFYTPFYRWILAEMWQAGGSLETGLVWLTPLVLSIYLVGMFWLLRRVVGNLWLVLSLTVVSASYQLSLGEEIWGVAGSSHLLARTLFAAVVPYLILLLLSVLEEPDWLKGGLLGLGLGLATNLHPTSGLHLAMLVGAMLLLRAWQPAARRTWLALGSIAVGIVAGAWPVASNFVANTNRGVPARADFDTFSRTLAIFYNMPFSPPRINWPLLGVTLERPWLDYLVWLYAGLALIALGIYLGARRRWPGVVRWGWLIGGLVTVWYAYMITLFSLPLFFILIGFYVVYRFRRDAIRPLDLWLMTWTGLTVLLSFVAYYIFIQLWLRFELWSLMALFMQQLRAGRFVYVPVYLLTGLAGQALVEWLAENLSGPARFDWLDSGQARTIFSIPVALLLLLGPGLSTQFLNGWWQSGLALIGIAGGAALLPLAVLRLAKWFQSWPEWGWRLLGGVTGLLILFGPLAPLAGPYLTLPTVNLLDAQARAPQPIWHESDAELYRWVRTHTSQDALFYWCDFGPITTLNFRRQAQRSITHNWKDLNLMTFDQVAFVPAFERYRRLEAACTDLGSAVAMAHELHADFILASTAVAAGFETASCFANDRYLVFPGQAGQCPESLSESPQIDTDELR